ncbi:Ribonuclease H-like domain [Pseudocohnilembus persalinus]|uniref:Ribonuclease H-like domain n=1 Tax=Pseudocohnilembus persalinus TaxID=266149 RepID=A0A0V0QZ90_PSEPJ|nr:Ribonuclease H-like domain [Pseudocohnilembus persalinus]|eukprot:KRX07386.1 Ribonuclease H-like domain [Pseudocohnilembus persalinus]
MEAIDNQLTGNNFKQLLYTDRKINEQAQKVHGLKNEDLSDKKKFVEIIDELKEYLEGHDLIICHNVRFHIDMLNKAFKDAGGDFKIQKTHCTLQSSKKYKNKDNKKNQNSLVHLCAKYNIPYENKTKSVLLVSKVVADLYFGQPEIFNANQEKEEQVEVEEDIDIYQILEEHEEQQRNQQLQLNVEQQSNNQDESFDIDEILQEIEMEKLELQNLKKESDTEEEISDIDEFLEQNEYEKKEKQNLQQGKNNNQQGKNINIGEIQIKTYFAQNEQ